MSRKIQTTLLIIMSLIGYSACQESSYIENHLHGLWQVSTVEELASGNITPAKGNLYFSFQRNMVILGHRTESKPLGHMMTEQYASEFDLKGDSIGVGDFRIYMEYEKKVPTDSLKPFGIYDEYTTFAIDKPNRNSLILTSDKGIITMRRY